MNGSKTVQRQDVKCLGAWAASVGSPMFDVALRRERKKAWAIHQTDDAKSVSDLRWAPSARVWIEGGTWGGKKRLAG